MADFFKNPILISKKMNPDLLATPEAKRFIIRRRFSSMVQRKKSVKVTCEGWPYNVII